MLGPEPDVDSDDIAWLREELRLARREVKLVRTESEHLAESLHRVRRQRSRLREQVEGLSESLAVALSEAWWREQEQPGPARRWGRAGGRGAADADADEQAMVREVEASDLFDGAWYLRRYPKVARRRISPAVHLVRRGNELGHDPSEAFGTAAYLAAHPEASAAGLPALVHHLRHARSGRV